MSYEAYPGKMKAIGNYPAFWAVAKCGVLERENAMGSHVIMHQRHHHKNKLSRCQVPCHTTTTKMAVQFDLIRAGQVVKAEIDSDTPLMPA